MVKTFGEKEGAMLYRRMRMKVKYFVICEENKIDTKLRPESILIENTK
jgi:hypothetical protein